MRLHLRTLMVMACLTEAACTGVPPAVADPEVNDPAEATNRRIFGVNMAIDHTVTKPVATAYTNDLPDGVRRAVHNFTTNLGEPKILVNDLLQGNLRRASNTTGRFLLNATVGVAGLFDVADRIGLPHHEADFGQTFGVWGVGPGPAVQLPLLGSSNVRDSIGSVFGLVADPLLLVPGGTIVTATGAGAGGVDTRAGLLDTSNDLEKHSLDYYAVLRGISAQRRSALVRDGRAGLVRPGADVTARAAD